MILRAAARPAVLTSLGEALALCRESETLQRYLLALRGEEKKFPKSNKL